jgi:hypothetical protein
MCRLYSSPKEVTSEVTWRVACIVEVVCRLCVYGSARLRVRRIMAQARALPILPTFAFNKDAFPNRQRSSRRRIIHLAETSPALLRKFSSAISGFRSLCGREQHSFSHCAQKTFAFWNR